jgi:hypothetical protein
MVAMSSLPTRMAVRAAIAAGALAVLGCKTPRKFPDVPMRYEMKSSVLADGSKAALLDGEWVATQEGRGLAGHVACPLQLEVFGDYVLAHIGADHGRIDGRLEGNRVRGTWSEQDGSGEVELEFTPDGKSFHGRFSGMLHDQPVPEGSTWSGVHVASRQSGGGSLPPWEER